jgi:2-oxoisovalerate dehydrogenase E2 component (dihydrolipoyl transacylase)
MAKDVVLPELAESVVEGEIVTWLVAAGEPVAADQPLVEVMTDKVTVELPSPYTGTLVERVAEVGDVVAVGAVIARIDESAAAAAAVAAAVSAAGGARIDERDDGDGDAGGEDRGDERSLFRAEAQPVGGPVLQVRRPAGPAGGAPRGAPVAAPPRPTKAIRGAFGRVVAVPAARRLARELGLPIEQVEGSGPSGRIRVADVERHEQAPVLGSAGGAALPHPPRYRTPPGFETRETRVPLRGLRRVIAQHLSASHLHTVRALHVDEAEVSALVRLRETLKPRAEARGVKLSYFPFVMKAVLLALKAFPMLNVSLDEEAQEIVHKDYYNLGVAVATDAGLMVPVIHDADQRSLLELASETQRLAEEARRGSLTQEHVHGSSFTLTNIGSIGGLFSFPIINAPDAAVLGVHSVRKRPVALDDDSIAVRPMLYLSLSFDHRLVDGAEGARFTSFVIELLETPEALLLDA